MLKTNKGIEKDDIYFFNVNVDINGLSDMEAEARLRQFGTNELKKKKRKTAIEIFLSQFTDFIVLVLIAATVISFFLGEIIDASAILIIVVINAVFGFIQEYRTERSLEALKEMSAPSAHVIRNGKIMEISASMVVPQDVILIKAGDVVPADAALIEANNITVNESLLTGESLPVHKSTVKISGGMFIDIKKENMVYMGCPVVNGNGKAYVLATGMNTEMGKIADMLQDIKDDSTPLQKRLDRIGKELVGISLGICLIMIILGILYGQSTYNMFFAGISLAVAAIPEGLPAIVTVSLAIGVQNMLKRNALVRRLPAVETLGCTNVICSDKTGTLTENKMTVKKIFVDNKIIDVSGIGFNLQGNFSISGKKANIRSFPTMDLLLKTAVLCNKSELRIPKKGNVEAVGDPTETALLVVAHKAGYTSKNLLTMFKPVGEIPFDSDRKLMSTIFRSSNGDIYIFVKGAPDRLIELCSSYQVENKVMPLSLTYKRMITSVNNEMAGSAMRVLGLAYKKINFIPRELKPSEIESSLTFLGLMAMVDPPRTGVTESVLSCKRAGIIPVMITGDHRITAMAIAKEIGICNNTNESITGEELDKLSDKEFEKKVKNIRVFARVNPGHKLRIVRALKKNGYIVAMTGDGVNDAPALKEADIGIAMGKSGTEVAKEAASMILLDDNFTSIVKAIMEGRIIYDNIRKSIRYLLSCNLGEMLMMFVATAINMTLPLIPLQILWINLVTDGLPALALGMDPPEPDIMEKPPRPTNEGIFSRGLGPHILFSGLIIGASSLTAFSLTQYLSNGNVELSRTVSFATLIIAELLNALECRSEAHTIFEAGLFKNIYLILACLSSFILLLIVLYIPPLRLIFKTTPLNLDSWAIVIVFSTIEFALNNIFKK
ncbi:calcium-translocating P-type ATPase, SERCA-type [Calorimonas adulescens]|uniref:Calcium-translocating P-type ATPase, SERCA-type n=1 Tax=Calorimonas adulescens TaxID=2606906 RepID=A0A5D8QF57_9THEO|nr:calcium-translocating P-type ATPase, SERCA-type [Calorimonas adulescens]TZE82819.1 calcium-translocating P-type ATPase, SERCA-type [Calorimonas adulescens]